MCRCNITYIRNMTTINADFKTYVDKMPAEINTMKDIKEYLKQFEKEYKEKAKEAKVAKVAEKPKRKKGVDKDGNVKEKRAPSAYNVFVKEKYAEIKEANPVLDKTEIFSEIAKLWREKKEKIDSKSGEKVAVEEEEKPSDKEEEVAEVPQKKPARKAIKKKEKVKEESDENDE